MFSTLERMQLFSAFRKMPHLYLAKAPSLSSLNNSISIRDDWINNCVLARVVYEMACHQWQTNIIIGKLYESLDSIDPLWVKATPELRARGKRLLLFIASKYIGKPRNATLAAFRSVFGRMKNKACENPSLRRGRSVFQLTCVTRRKH